MGKNSGLTKSQLTQRIRMNEWAQGAEIQKVSHEGEQDSPAYAPLAWSCF